MRIARTPMAERFEEEEQDCVRVESADPSFAQCLYSALVTWIVMNAPMSACCSLHVRCVVSFQFVAVILHDRGMLGAFHIVNMIGLMKNFV
jgi:hypothetical protein